MVTIPIPSRAKIKRQDARKQRRERLAIAATYAAITAAVLAGVVHYAGGLDAFIAAQIDGAQEFLALLEQERNK